MKKLFYAFYGEYCCWWLYSVFWCGKSLRINGLSFCRV